jgi:hypothetical protein
VEYRNEYRRQMLEMVVRRRIGTSIEIFGLESFLMEIRELFVRGRCVKLISQLCIKREWQMVSVRQLPQSCYIAYGL